MSSFMDNSWVINTLQIGLPFAAFFLGIIVRKFGLPGPNSPPLRCQILLGLPVSLLIVSPVLSVFGGAIHNPPAYLLTLGMMIEQGMLVTETATKHLTDLMEHSGKASPAVSGLRATE
jgi:MFS family permease